MENLPLHSSDFNNIYDLVKLEAHFVISLPLKGALVPFSGKKAFRETCLLCAFSRLLL